MKRKICAGSLLVLGIFISCISLSFADNLKNCPEDTFYIVEQSKTEYFFKKDYKGFLAYLNKHKSCLGEEFIKYYTASARFAELKQYEDSQDWQRYFDLKEDYFTVIENNLSEVINAISSSVNAFQIEALYLDWILEKQKTGFNENEKLDALMEYIKDYDNDPSQFKLLKSVADRLLDEGLDRQSGIIYDIYAKKLIKNNLNSDLLLKTAEDAFKDGRFKLARSLYTAYLEVIYSTASKQEYLEHIIRIINLFVDIGWQPGIDSDFAEELFQQLEENFSEGFDATILFLRAYNLERMSFYQEAITQFRQFITRFPNDEKINQALFHAGMIELYLLNKKEGLDLLKQIVDKNNKSGYLKSALYYSALYLQKEDLTEQAKAYYQKLKDILEADTIIDGKLLSLTNDRLNEINNTKPLENNLRFFMEAGFDSVKLLGNVSITPVPAKAYVNDNVEMASSYFVGNVGCFQPVLDFIWSGDLGSASVLNSTQQFSTTYSTQGPKIILLSVKSAIELVGKHIAIIEIFKKGQENN
ncbi:MAG: hypothetical protein P9L96_03885 [Candidatus Gygaella obscura]|nr:hypothetical protein [Candidatus Gygaella obscura]